MGGSHKTGAYVDKHKMTNKFILEDYTDIFGSSLHCITHALRNVISFNHVRNVYKH